MKLNILLSTTVIGLSFYSTFSFAIINQQAIHFTGDVINNTCAIHSDSSDIEMGEIMLKDIINTAEDVFFGNRKGIIITIEKCHHIHEPHIHYEGNIKNNSLANQLNDHEHAAGGVGIVLFDSVNQIIFPGHKIRIPDLYDENIPLSKTVYVNAGYKKISAIEDVKAGKFKTVASLVVNYN